MTLIKMLYDTLSFIFLLACYMLITTSIFTALFLDASPDGHENSDKYGNLWFSFKSLYAAFIGEFDFKVEENYELSFSILMIIHVFIANIFLLNYLVAILSTVYEYMFYGGEFSYKANMYRYIEKYSIPDENKKGRGEVVMHPPPINILSYFIVLPFICKGSWMKGAGACFSKLIYWIENVFFIFMFSGGLSILFPLLFIKIIIDILRKSAFRHMLFFLIIWIIISPLFFVYLVFKDTFFFIQLLCVQQEDEEKKSEKKE